MSSRPATVRTLDAWPLAGPVHRSIVALDVEKSTERTNPVKGELRRILYYLVDRTLQMAGITAEHLEQLTDRGDGVLILIRPHDDVPKTVLLGRLIPFLTTLLADYNATVTLPPLRMRLRAVVHAGEVHDDGKGFYGEDLDVAFRLLDSPTVKGILRRAPLSPLVLVVSDEIFTGIIRHGYVSGGPYEQAVRVRVAGRVHRGWVHLSVPDDLDHPAVAHPQPPRALTLATVDGEVRDHPANRVSGRGGRRSGRG